MGGSMEDGKWGRALAGEDVAQPRRADPSPPSLRSGSLGRGANSFALTFQPTEPRPRGRGSGVRPVRGTGFDSRMV
jgi:hypothetical protein